MVIVVSGTHASGKTSLIDAFATAQPQFRIPPDPFETLANYSTDAGAGIFYQQPRLMPNTASPGWNLFTPDPTATTVPATSNPGTRLLGRRNPNPMMRIR